MTKLTDAAAVLARIPYLAALSPAARAALAAACRERVVPRGATIFAEGEPAEGVFVVLDGRVRVSRVTGAGREQVLHEEGAGATLAEVPVFDGGGCVGSAIATTDTRVLLIPRAPLVSALDAHPAAAARVIGVLAARVRRFAGLAADLSLQSVDARVARDLLARAAPPAADVIVPATRDLWAAELGTVREQVSRALSRFARLGAIRVAGRRITILRRAVLADIAGA